MPYNYKDCIKEGLLKRIPASQDKALKSIEKGEKWLEDGQKSSQIEAFDSSVLASYMGFFHSARAVLFRDGFRERSHACIARYLEEIYVKSGKLEKEWVELLDHYREIRHEDQYNLSFITTKDEAEKALKSALEFIQRMKTLLGIR